MVFYYALNTSKWTSKFSGLFVLKMQVKTLEMRSSLSHFLPVSIFTLFVFVFFLYCLHSFFVAHTQTHAYPSCVAHCRLCTLIKTREATHACHVRPYWIGRLNFQCNNKMFCCRFLASVLLFVHKIHNNEKRTSKANAATNTFAFISYYNLRFFAAKI